ncbi:MAG TPA: hypothetical protein VGK50_08265 [Coriobacteriia bacterium]|jgi:ABC-type Zn2+ transport system substrate-binding protein/surface adhesin
MTGWAKRSGAAALVAVAIAASTGLTGCAQDQRQTTIVVEPSGKALTPLQRGEIRRDVLRTAREGMDAWKRNDVAKMRSYFGTDLVAFYDKTYKDYAKAGKVRVRRYRDVAPLEMTDINTAGTEALATWEFYDDSYFADSSGKPLTKPTGKDTSLQLALDKKRGKWTIVRLIGANAVLK